MTENLPENVSVEGQLFCMKGVVFAGSIAIKKNLLAKSH